MKLGRTRRVTFRLLEATEGDGYHRVVRASVRANGRLPEMVQRLFGALPSSGSWVEIKVFALLAVSLRTRWFQARVVVQRVCRAPQCAEVSAHCWTSSLTSSAIGGRPGWF
jgi:hypothetical protein